MRTLIKIKKEGAFTRVNTISKERKSPHYFLLFTDKLHEFLDRKETGCIHTESDIGSFVKIHINAYKRQTTIVFDFYWLSEYREGRLTGYHETIEVYYQTIMDMLNSPKTEDEIKVLSIHRDSQPKVIPQQHDTLKRVIDDPIVRRQFSKYLRDSFPNAYQILLYNDYGKYDFFFTEITHTGKEGFSGGIIYSSYINGNNIPVNRYSMHT